MNKNNTGLVAYAKKALAEGWGYVWGTFGTLLTEERLQKKIQQYPAMVGGYQKIIRQKWLGRKTSDCVGLIKSYIWYDGTEPKYDGKYDVSADGMFNKAKVKGPIATIPETPGLCVWKEGHIGVYIGGGYVIEAHKTSIGVIKTPLRGKGATPWTNWLECPFIDYPAATEHEYPKAGTAAPKSKYAAEIAALCKQLGVPGTAQLPQLQTGDHSKAVEYIQKRLGAKVDGIYGQLTESVVKAYQVRSGLTADGIVGPKTWAMLAE